MKLVWSGILLGSAALALSCGSRSRLLNADGGAGGTTGGSGGVGAVSGSGGFGGAPIGGAGGTAGCAPVDTGAPCFTMGEMGCLAAFPRCTPVYDDQCCPMCNPGMCADCMNWQFYECIDRELSSCVPGAIGHCGQTPSWACNGGKAQCDQSACQFTPGCISAQPANCPPDGFCPPECHAVTAETCGPICGPPVPMPMCPNAGVHEVQNGQYTGYCIDASVCAQKPEPPPDPGMCPDTTPSGKCSVEGQVCSYGSWCTSTCTCKNGFWGCITPPC